MGRRALMRLALLALFLPFTIQAQTVRIGVLGLFHPNTLTLQASERTLSVTGNGNTLILTSQLHRQIVFRASGDRVIVGNSAADTWQASARDGSGVRFQLSVPGKIRRVYEGTVVITAHRGELIPVVSMQMETALLSIVAAEMPVRAPLEALKAQAVVSRSILAAGARHTDYEFCDTTHCQFLRSPDTGSETVIQAVRATRGLILSFQQRPLAAMFASRCGGSTHTLRELGMDPGSGYPYFAVRCGWCRQHPVHWQSRIQTDDASPASNNESARIAHARKWGWSSVPGSTFSSQKDADGVTLTGHSIGHGLGMCQYGAMGMAAAGADFRSILAHYYPNTELVPLH